MVLDLRLKFKLCEYFWPETTSKDDFLVFKIYAKEYVTREENIGVDMVNKEKCHLKKK